MESKILELETTENKHLAKNVSCCDYASVQILDKHNIVIALKSPTCRQLYACIVRKKLTLYQFHPGAVFAALNPEHSEIVLEKDGIFSFKTELDKYGYLRGDVYSFIGEPGIHSQLSISPLSIDLIYSGDGLVIDAKWLDPANITITKSDIFDSVTAKFFDDKAKGLTENEIIDYVVQNGYPYFDVDTYFYDLRLILDDNFNFEDMKFVYES